MSISRDTFYRYRELAGEGGVDALIIRKVIYTTNAIESVHRQFRKLTKTKGAFPNENSLLELLYLRLMNAQEKWTMPIQSWTLTLSQLAIYFERRLNNIMTL